MSARPITTSFALLALAVVVVSVSCASNGPTSPTASSTPPAAPAPTPTPAAPATAVVTFAINPNPVPFSGQPITDSAGCAGSKNTWFYTQVATESGGAAVTFTSRVDKFDGRVVNTLTGLNLVVPAKGTLSISSRWCSSQAVAHTAQSTFMGIDVNGHTINVDAPVANLRSP
jgi:hypothetical protein